MLTGVILCGHDAQEDGFIKSLNIIAGLPIIERQINEMQVFCKEILIVTNQPRLFLSVVPRNIRIITDYYKQKGPLSGIHASLSLAKAENVWIISHDLPYPNGKAIQAMLPIMAKGKFQAIFPSTNNTLHFYHSLYNRDILPIVEHALDSGQNHPSHILDKISFTKVNSGYFHKYNLDMNFLLTDCT